MAHTKTSKTSPKRKGLRILLIVVIVIGCLPFALLVGVFVYFMVSSSINGKRAEVEANKEIPQIQAALEDYYQKNKRYPEQVDFETLVSNDVLTNSKLGTPYDYDPSTKDPYATFSQYENPKYCRYKLRLYQESFFGESGDSVTVKEWRSPDHC